MRADRWAAQQVDPLLLAESLLVVVSTLPLHSDNCCAAFSCAAPRHRLEERIDALLAPQLSYQPSLLSWSWLLLAFYLLLLCLFTLVLIMVLLTNAECKYRKGQAERTRDCIVILSKASVVPDLAKEDTSDPGKFFTLWFRQIRERRLTIADS
jgi:hypothetical protein